MKNIEKIIEKFAIESNYLDYYFLTEKELDRIQIFLRDLTKKNEYMDTKEIYLSHPDLAIDNCKSLINGLNDYIRSLHIKIAQRSRMPSWYRNNKLS